MTVQPLYQQHLTPVIGADRADRACLPTCFYMLARAYGYLQDIEFEQFVVGLDWTDSYRDGTGWIRPRLTAEIRRRYGVPIVSWQLNGAADTARMAASGYLGGQREINWFERNVADWPVDVIVAAGTPVIATMAPGFGENKSVHAVILAALKDDRYEVINPDARSDQRFYGIDEIHRMTSPAAAGSIILPPVR